MDDDLIEAHGDCAKLMPYLHLPVQSGSDRILKRMNRSHTAESYLRVIERIRAARPDILLSGDFIVGFPEETDADFQATLDLIEAVNYGYAYSFKYSTRPGTPAAERAAGRPEDVPIDRLQRLAGPDHPPAARRAGRDGGPRVSACCSKNRAAMPGQMVGKSEYLHAVHVDDPAAASRRDRAGQNRRQPEPIRWRPDR